MALKTDGSDIIDYIDHSDSVYALAATKVVEDGWDRGTVRLVAALFFTVFLQLALVGLLWQVAATGNLNSKRSEADNVWVELGRTRRHLVALQNSFSQLKPNETLRTPCLDTLCDYWPHFPGAGSDNLSAAAMHEECKNYFCCFVAHPECLLAVGTTEADIMNESHVDTSVNATGFVDPCDTQLPSHISKTQWLEMGCDTVICAYYAADHELPTLEYGWGLFHATDSFPKQQDNKRCGEKPLNEHEFFGHVNSWFHRNRYEHEPTVFVMVSYLVMLVVSFNEARHATYLLVYSAAKAKALPDFYASGLFQQGQAPGGQGGLPQVSACFILLAPVLQLLVAFVLMGCGGSLLLITDLQNSRASIIFNAVALAFVVDLDDRIGLIMKMQQPWMRKQGTGSNNAGAGKQSHARPLAGHIVFGIVGWLLLSHCLLVAPQTPAQILAFFTTTWAYIERKQADIGAKVLSEWTSNDDLYLDGMTYNVFKDPRVRAVDYINLNSSIWNTYAFLGFPGLTRLPSKSSAQMPIDRAGAIVMCSLYLLVAVCTVLLLCHSLLPCSDAHWHWVLTGVQVLLVIVAQLQYLTVFKNEWGPEGIKRQSRQDISADPMEVQKFGFLAVLILLFVSWLAMFVLWPLKYWYMRGHNKPSNDGLDLSQSVQSV